MYETLIWDRSDSLHPTSAFGWLLSLMQSFASHDRSDGWLLCMQWDHCRDGDICASVVSRRRISLVLYLETANFARLLRQRIALVFLFWFPPSVHRVRRRRSSRVSFRSETAFIACFFSNSNSQFVVDIPNRPCIRRHPFRIQALQEGNGESSNDCGVGSLWCHLALIISSFDCLFSFCNPVLLYYDLIILYLSFI